MNHARRSERLRRKRQSTPGLSAPGAYSLYGSGYVVESEASFLPNPPASLPRRTRYKDSPHVLAADSSAAHPQPASLATPPSAAAAHPDRLRRRHSIVDRVRLSLFDILGSQARRPARNRWQAIADDDIVDDHDDADAERDDPRVHRDRARAFAQPDFDEDLDHAPPDRAVNPLTRSAMLPLLILAALLVLGIPLLLALESRAHARSAARSGYFSRAARRPTWATLRASWDSRAWPRAPAPVAPVWARRAAAAAREGAHCAWCAAKAGAQLLLRGAWSGRARADAGGDYVSRGELDTLLPDIVSRARQTAAEEAARVARELGAEAVRGAGKNGADSFKSFSERYAADKGLPADYALASVGASVIKSEPSVGSGYVRYVREYVEALVRQRAFKPLLPNRPRMALTADVLPGNCWAFPGETGSLTVQLARPVRVESVTMEHTPEKSVFSSVSAPRRFRVVGLPIGSVGRGDGEEEVLLGEFVFCFGEGESHLQTFVVKPAAAMRVVRFEVLSNHGSPHTSVYRVRVHGEEATDAIAG